LIGIIIRMGKADIHIHTTYSYDSSCSVPSALEWAVNVMGLSVIAVTDHDRMEGALEAMQRAPAFGIEVIPGCEITARDGHVLGLFIEKPVPAGLSFLETVLRIGEQGGLAVAAHPTASIARGADENTLRAVLAHPEARRALAGIETWNSGVWPQGANLRAQRINTRLKLAETGGSDSHVFWTIGFGFTEFPGTSAADFRKALENRATSAHRLNSRHTPVYWARHIFHRLVREAGWGTWTPAPEAGFGFTRLARVQPIVP
jgi:predicted metal-dependent phosphoesterase TrpH